MKHEQFCSTLDSRLNAIKITTMTVIGTDINARIGTHTCADHANVNGPHGIKRGNVRGENLLHVLVSHRLRVENTFFKHRAEEYVTYTSLPNSLYPQGVPSMHDIFASSQSLHKWIRICKAVLDGVKSDHRAVQQKIMLLSIKFKSRVVSRGTINWQKILSDENLQMVYSKHLQSMTTPDMDYDDYNKIIIRAGELTATAHKRNCKGWFQASQSTLGPLLAYRNRLLHSICQTSHLPPSTQASMKADLTRLNHHIAHAISHAKAKWYADICTKIHGMQMEPQLAWEPIRLLTKGETAHHCKRTNMVMQMAHGTHATNASENMSVFSPHFYNVFNNHRSTDPKILQHIPQQHTMWGLNDSINYDEFSRAVQKLTNAKAAGLTGVRPKAFKAMHLCQPPTHLQICE
jgi:hypothetical protein